MANDKLENLVKIRQLKSESATDDEIAGLMRSGSVRLEDAKNVSLSRESRFDLAYNAAHALSLAALRGAGYRSESRYLVFQCTQHTLDLASEHWRVLELTGNETWQSTRVRLTLTISFSKHSLEWPKSSRASCRTKTKSLREFCVVQS